MTGVAEPKSEPRPHSKALGGHVRALRQVRGITQIALAKEAGLRNAQLSKLETGGNVEVEQYELVARALKFRNALEMFRAPTDTAMRKLLRYWPLLDESARTDLAQQAKATIDADAE